MATVDPITRSVIANSLSDIASEMDNIIVHSARNIPVILSHDFSVAITDRNGNLVSATQGIPVHLGGIDITVKWVMEKVGRIEPDDVVLTNDPFKSANTHMPDFTMVTPIAEDSESEPVLYLAVRVDQADIGAKDPTRSPTDTKVAYNEGLLIPPVRVVKDGNIQKDILDLLARNSRVPDVQRGDVSAMIGALQKGKERTKDLVERYSPTGVTASVQQLINRTREETEAYVESLPNGTYYGEGKTDSSPNVEKPVTIAVEIEIDGTEVTFDFTGTDEQLEAPINNTLGVTHAAVNSAWFAVVDVDTPFNYGCIDMLDIVAPEGTVVNPTFPAATGYSTVDCMQETMEACLDALGSVDPQNVPAGWSRWVRPFLSGKRPETGEEYRGTITSIMGGGGAIHGHDGANSIGSIILMAGLVGMDPEHYEAMYPMKIHEMELRTDSGGCGRWRGGLGPNVVIEPSNHESMFSIGGDFGQQSPPAGRAGGSPGEATRVIIDRNGDIEELERSWVDKYLSDGDKYVQKSGGGGGIGNPHERPAKRVLTDVKNSYVSKQAAKEQYGVSIVKDSDGNLGVDPNKTAQLRGGDAQ
jgi:N-methylhydantoinase B